MPKVDDPILVPKTDGSRYVTVPDTDMFDMPHPGVRLNHESYGPGTYLLDKERADTVEGALKGYEIANRRILQPRQDANAISAVNKGTGRPMTPWTGN
jgi:hypothetical protein